jgi:hypothetical protein
MTKEECYAETIEWLGKHTSNRVIITVKSDKELKQYQKYFKDEMANDLFVDPEIYDIIEWKVCP